jgi:hypothetical protein
MYLRIEIYAASIAQENLPGVGALASVTERDARYEILNGEPAKSGVPSNAIVIPIVFCDSPRDFRLKEADIALFCSFIRRHLPRNSLSSLAQPIYGTVDCHRSECFAQ